MANIKTLSVRNEQGVFVGANIDDLITYLNEGIAKLDEKGVEVEVLKSLVTDLTKLKEDHLSSPEFLQSCMNS
jgi:hypothetical protein